MDTDRLCISPPSLDPRALFANFVQSTQLLASEAPMSHLCCLKIWVWMSPSHPYAPPSQVMALCKPCFSRFVSFTRTRFLPFPFSETQEHLTNQAYTTTLLKRHGYHFYFQVEEPEDEESYTQKHRLWSASPLLLCVRFSWGSCEDEMH